MIKSSIGAIAATAVALVLVLAGAGWWHHTSRPEYRYRTGCEAARTGDLARAIRQADALEASGQTDLALLVRAEAEYHQGFAQQALVYLHKIESEGDVLTRSAILTAKCLIEMKNPREAERAALFVLSREPDQIDAHRCLAEIYYDQGDFRLALPQMQQVADLDPTDEKPHYWIGLIYKDSDEPAVAVAAFAESLRRNPNGPKADETRLELAEVQMKSMQAADVLATLGEMNSAQAVALRAEALVAVGRAADAIPLLDSALAASPNHVGLLRQRAERFRDAGDNESAAKLLERAAAADPHDFRVRTQLALCYRAIGRAADAAEQEEKVRETQGLFQKLNALSQDAMRDPWDAGVRIKLADLCDRVGKPKLAKMWRDAAQACRSARPPSGGR